MSSFEDLQLPLVRAVYSHPNFQLRNTEDPPRALTDSNIINILQNQVFQVFHGDFPRKTIVIFHAFISFYQLSRSADCCLMKSQGTQGCQAGINFGARSFSCACSGRSFLGEKAAAYYSNHGRTWKGKKIEMDQL